MDTIGIEPSSGSIIMTVKGAADMVGRFSAGFMGEKLPFPLIHIYVICPGVMAITTYLCTYAKSFIDMFFYALGKKLLSFHFFLSVQCTSFPPLPLSMFPTHANNVEKGSVY